MPRTTNPRCTLLINSCAPGRPCQRPPCCGWTRSAQDARARQRRPVGLSPAAKRCPCPGWARHSRLHPHSGPGTALSAGAVCSVSRGQRGTQGSHSWAAALWAYARWVPSWEVQGGGSLKQSPAGRSAQDSAPEPRCAARLSAACANRPPSGSGVARLRSGQLACDPVQREEAVSVGGRAVVPTRDVDAVRWRQVALLPHAAVRVLQARSRQQMLLRWSEGTQCGTSGSGTLWPGYVQQQVQAGPLPTHPSPKEGSLGPTPAPPWDP
jgi:hypothetical protein